MTLHAATVQILDDWLVRTQRAALVPSLSVAVARGGETVWTGCLGEELRPLRRTDGTPRALDIATFHFTRAPHDPGTGVPGEQPDHSWY